MNRESLLQLSCTICGNTKLYDKNSSWVCNKCKNKYSFVEKGIHDCSKNIFGSDTYHWHNDIATNQNKSSPKSVGFKFSFHQKCLIDVFIDATKDIDKGLFLDVGCGNGSFCEKLIEKNSYLTPFYALDFSLNQLRKVDKSKIYTFKADAENMPFASNQFSLIICSEVIQNLENIDFIFQEISRVLKKGGIAIVSSLNANSIIRKFIMKIDPNNKNKNYLLRDKGEPNIFLRSPSELKLKANNNDLVFTKTYWLFSPINYFLLRNDWINPFYSSLAQNFACVFRKK